jgi:hypothetical protein
VGRPIEQRPQRLGRLGFGDAVLDLTTLPVRRHHHPPGDLCGVRGTVIVANQLQTQVDPGARAGATAYVLEMDPGSCWQGIDVHEPGPEEVYVVDGVFNDGIRDYPAGSFIHAPAGSSHVPQSSQGCTLFVFYPEG